MSGTHAIAEAYARRIRRGDITLDNVPVPIRQQVAELLNAKER